MTSGVLLAVCRVHALLPTKDSTGVTAIDKRPVDGPVKVHPLGLTGDIQASRKHHGGPTKALYAYSQEDADYWSAELGRDMVPGKFGENLRVSGIDATHAVIGERWRIGDVLLEVSETRTPCMNFARFIGEPSWVKRFAAAGRVGTYLSVIKGGHIEAGDAVVVESRPEHGVTVGQLFAGLSLEQAVRLQAAADAGAKLTPDVAKAVARAQQ
ncbi:MOSC domain-containing protein [Arthrobacter sp. JZ12]|uniref:MOSC domain-containing protein n=1 Tax=Arthrobacter sp. JZ12 TaxID=2654190 RepID=UPI002B4A6986|nr:MOSC domain-containing protein [Arthrobacter sp. JZ12]WRH25650.1 MOSC domain-containing protein [Arthrobacter sp. JZ12]